MAYFLVGILMFITVMRASKYKKYGNEGKTSFFCNVLRKKVSENVFNINKNMINNNCTS